MFAFLPSLFAKFFPEAAKCAARRRQARYAEHAARQRRTHYFRPRLEDLEERIVPDAYTFADPVTGLPSTGNWSNPALWTDTKNGAPGVPGENDTADIPVGAVCTLDSGATSKGVTVEGSLTVQSTLTIEGNVSAGQGSLGISGGSVTVGGPNGTSSGTIDTINLGMTINPASGVSGALAIGDPGTGMGGVVDVSGTFTDTAGGYVSNTLTVGGAGGSSGLLDVYSLSVAPTTINANGTIDVKHDADFVGPTAIDGGVISAENIDAFTGASVTFDGPTTVAAGPLSGNLNAEENASFTFSPFSSVTLFPGATIGDGKFFIDGPLTVDEAITISNAEFVLKNDGGISTLGSIGGSGSIAWYNHEFDWEGGTIGGLTGGGFTIEGQADFHTSGAGAKELATTLTNLGPSTVDLGGTGILTIDGPGSPAGTGALLNYASAIIPMEISVPLIMGGGTFTNAGYVDITMDPTIGPTGVTIAAPLNNTPGGVIDVLIGDGPLTLADTSGTSILDGSVDLNSNSLTISGIYTMDSSLSVDHSGGTTISGTLTIGGGTSADIDALILAYGGTITGAGDLTVDGDCYWMSGTISGSGGMTVGGAGTLYLEGSGTLSRNLDVEGTVLWESISNSFASGTEVDIKEPGMFNDQVGGSISTLNNDGTLEIGTSDILTLGTFTQSSSGTLQIDIASDNPYGQGLLNVSGTATLDGTLDGNLENGYQPPSGTVFDVLNFGSSSGQFATVNPQGWSAQYNSNSVDLVSS